MDTVSVGVSRCGFTTWPVSLSSSAWAVSCIGEGSGIDDGTHLSSFGLDCRSRSKGIHHGL